MSQRLKVDVDADQPRIGSMAFHDGDHLPFVIAYGATAVALIGSHVRLKLHRFVIVGKHPANDLANMSGRIDPQALRTDGASSERVNALAMRCTFVGKFERQSIFRQWIFDLQQCQVERLVTIHDTSTQGTRRIKRRGGIRVQSPCNELRKVDLTILRALDHVVVCDHQTIVSINDPSRASTGRLVGSDLDQNDALEHPFVSRVADFLMVGCVLRTSLGSRSMLLNLLSKGGFLCLLLSRALVFCQTRDVGDYR